MDYQKENRRAWLGDLQADFIKSRFYRFSFPLAIVLGIVLGLIIINL